MTDNILLFTALFGYLIGFIVSFRTNRIHSFYIGIISGFISALLIYMGYFLYYENEIILLYLPYVLILFGLVILPIQILFDKNIYKRYTSISKAVSIIVVLIGVILYSFIHTNSITEIIPTTEYIRIALIVLIVICLFTTAFLIVSIKLFKFTSFELSLILISLVLVSIFYRYNNNAIHYRDDRDEIVIEFTDVIEPVPTSNLLTLDQYNFYGYFDNKLYFIDHWRHGYGEANFGYFDLETETINVSSLALFNLYKFENSTAKVFFYEGETYIGIDDRLFFKDGDDFDLVLNVDNGNFDYAISYVEDNKFYIEQHERRYHVLDGEVVQNRDAIYNHFDWDENTGSFVGSVNNQVYAMNQNQLYYNGIYYDLSVYRDDVDYYNGIFEVGDYYIQDDVLHEKESSGKLIVINDKQYSLSSYGLTDTTTMMTYNILPYKSFVVVDGLNEPLYFAGNTFTEDYQTYFVTFDFETTEKISINDYNHYEDTYYIFAIPVLLVFQAIKEFRKSKKK